MANQAEPNCLVDGDGSKVGRWVTLGVDPIEQLCCRGLPGEHKASNPFEALRNLKPGHWTGWLSYEAAAWIEPCNPWKPDKIATLWIASHDPVLKFDLQKKQLWLEGSNNNRFQQFANWLEKTPTQKHEKGQDSSCIKFAENASQYFPTLSYYTVPKFPFSN